MQIPLSASAAEGAGTVNFLSFFLFFLTFFEAGQLCCTGATFLVAGREEECPLFLAVLFTLPLFLH